MHIMMWEKKSSCPGLSRGDKIWRQRQSTEWHHYTFHRINNAIVAKIMVTMFSVSRIHFSGCNAERTDNKYIYTDKTHRVFSKFQFKKSRFTSDKTNPQINTKFQEVITQLWYLTVRRRQPGSYSFRLALWGTEFHDKEDIIHKVSASMKQERNGTNWTQCPYFTAVKGR